MSDNNAVRKCAVCCVTWLLLSSAHLLHNFCFLQWLMYVLLLCARLNFGGWTFLRHQLTWLQTTCGFYWDIYPSRRQMNSGSLLGFNVPTLFYNQVFCCEQSTTDDKSLSFQSAEIVSSALACQPRCLNFWTLYVVSLPFSAGPLIRATWARGTAFPLEKNRRGTPFPAFPSILPLVLDVRFYVFAGLLYSHFVCLYACVLCYLLVYINE